MAAKFRFAPSLFEKNASRYLRIDDSLRNLVIGGKIHGQRPQQFSNIAYKMLCLNVVLRGRGRYTDATGREWELVPGSLFHRFPGVKHSTWYDPDSDYAEFFVVFDGVTGRQLMDLGVISDAPVEFVGVDPTILEEYQQLAKRAKQPESEFPSRRAIIESLAFINGLYDRARSNRKLSFWEKTIEDACSLLSHNLDQPKSAQTVAEQLGVTYAALRKHFKLRTGFSPTDYRIRCRIEASQYTLMNMSVKATAKDYGYCDSFAFSRQFKRFMGMSPREFQRRHRETFVRTPLTQSPQRVQRVSLTGHRLFT